jgi:hypothetical protein
VRDLFPSEHDDRIRTKVDDRVLALLADSVTGQLGGKVGIAPRVFLRKLVSDLLDRVDLFEDFEPLRDYKPVVAAAELSDEERAAAGLAGAPGLSVDDIELDP